MATAGQILNLMNIAAVAEHLDVRSETFAPL